MNRARLPLLLALTALAALAPGCASRRPADPPRISPAQSPSSVHPPSAPHSKLVVLLVVDQLPSWTFSRHKDSFRGGFARLVREGVYFPRAKYPYATTVTAIGHTALSTGATPHRAGIVGNTWWDRDKGRLVDTTEDGGHPCVPSHAKDDGASPQWRLVEAVGAGRRVLSLSYKERAAVLMAPSSGAVAAWYDPSLSEFVTSTAYAAARPPWLDALAREHPITPRLNYVWTALESTPHRALVTDASDGDVGNFGFGASFPHRVGETKRPAVAIGSTPVASEIVLEAVIAGLDAVRPELLDVSFSTHDLAAHAWGQDSWEATDVLFRLDVTIGKLLDALDERYGKDGWSLVLSADHGGPPMLARASDGLRIDLADVEKAITAAAGGGDVKRIAALDERTVWLSEAARSLPEAARLELESRVVDALKRVPGIGFAMTTEQFRKNADCTNLGELESLVCQSVYAGRSGDIYYGPRERSFVMRRPFEASFHGTPHPYDREVPIIVREPGRAARAVVEETPSTLRVAPTVARLLGAAAPPAAREPSL